MTRLIRFRVTLLRASVGLIVLLWLAIACLWIDKPGLHYDETIFVSGAFPKTSDGAVWVVDVLGRPVAVLVMSYMGALKGWMFRILLTVADPTVWTVRFPLLLLAAITVAMTYKLAAAMFTRITGLVAICLLCTDVTFLFTSRLDWGPVVIQRLCLVLGTLLVLSGGRDKVIPSRVLAGSFVLGVGLFDKLTFVWIVLGLLAALLLTYPRYVPKVAGNRLLPFYLAVLLLPLAPAMYYGAFVGQRDATTIEQHTDHFRDKYGMLAQSLDGTVLRGQIAHQTAESPTSAADLATSVLYHLDAIGRFEPGLLRPALVLAVLLIPLTAFLPGGRGRVFLLIFCTISLLPMALIEGAGSVHHITLIYPFPHILVASTLVSLATWTGKHIGRPLSLATIVATTVLIAAPNAMNIVHQYVELVRFGSRPIWSEAIYGLSEFVERHPADHVLVGDWGIEHQLIFLSNNELPLSSVPYADPEDQEALHLTMRLLKQPNTILIRFASTSVSRSPGQHGLVDQAARTAGLDLHLLNEFEDRQGRIVYHAYSVRRRLSYIGDDN